MTRIGYAALFALAVVGLSAGGISAFRHLDSLARAAEQTPPPTAWPQDSVPADKPFAPIAASAAEYAKYAAEDAEWRKRNARQYTLSEIRARGDGRRSARDALQDRVYAYMRSGERTRAIRELENWLKQNPRDRAALLWLARLLNESGRSDDAISRYRQLLGSGQAGGRQ
jgi:tetratricopeptide (TPR) repeat protein